MPRLISHNNTSPRLILQLEAEVDYKYAGCVCGGAGTYVLCESEECTLYVNNNDICEDGDEVHVSSTAVDISKAMEISTVKVGV